MQIIRKLGLIIFLGCLSLFIVLPFLGQYKLTESALNQTITDQNHHQLLKPALQTMMDKVYKSNSAFIADYNTALNGVNEEFKKKEQWDKVIYTDYSLTIVKNSSLGFIKDNTSMLFFICFILSALGGLMYIVPALFIKPIAGIKNDDIFHKAITSQGIIAFIFAAGLIAFYIYLYKAPAYISNWIILVDDLSYTISGSEASQWFLYGFLYCLVMTVMAVRMYIKYRNNTYQIVRTTSVLFFQIAFVYIHGKNSCSRI